MTPFDFFFEHAGYGYNPHTETPQQGRIKCARHLALAENTARKRGYSYSWSIDHEITSADWDDSRDPQTPCWQCVCRDLNGAIISSLGGIDFGENEPFNSPYRRVVEAELASEAQNATP